MKRTERRHLKDNELANFASSAQQAIDEHRREITATIAVIVVVGGAALGWFGWRQHVQSQAQAMLADAITVDGAPVGPPQVPGVKELRFATEHEKLEAELAKYKAVADKYPTTDAGLFARYRVGSIYMALGDANQATDAYVYVRDHGGKTVYARMASLGVAEAQTRVGNYDRAITMFKDMAAGKDANLPVDGVLMHLGRTYAVAGKRTEAEQTFNRVVQEFPDSPFVPDAKRELDNLKKTT
jgi:TolA-binding protein